MPRQNEPPAPPPRRQLIVTTGYEIAGRKIVRYLGIVRGIVVRAPNVGQKFLGGLKEVFGGNIESYANVCEQARADAYQRMRDHAKEKNADAVIGMRYDATEFAEGITEVLAYGTAVELDQPVR